MADVPPCVYCGGQPVLRPTSDHVYRKDYGPVWECPRCLARCGVHRGTNKPLGTVANAEDRLLRETAHGLFDPLWRRKMASAGIQKSHARSRAYRWLASEMGMEPARRHISMMHGDDLRRVIATCLKYARST